MNIELEVKDLSEYANQRMKQLVDQNIKQRLAEIQWYKTVDHIIYDVVKQEVTKEVIEKAIDSMDRQTLIEQISKSIAECLVDRL